MAAVGAARPGGGKLCLVQNNYLQSFSHSISSIEKNLEQIEWWYSIFKNNIAAADVGWDHLIFQWHLKNPVKQSKDSFQMSFNFSTYTAYPIYNYLA